MMENSLKNLKFKSPKKILFDFNYREIIYSDNIVDIKIYISTKNRFQIRIRHIRVNSDSRSPFYLFFFFFFTTHYSKHI